MEKIAVQINQETRHRYTDEYPSHTHVFFALKS